jgi:hypothetical protein
MLWSEAILPLSPQIALLAGQELPNVEATRTRYAVCTWLRFSAAFSNDPTQDRRSRVPEPQEGLFPVFTAQLADFGGKRDWSGKLQRGQEGKAVYAS